MTTERSCFSEAMMCLVEVGIHRRREGQSERLSAVAAVVVAAAAVAVDELISSAILDAILRDNLNFDHLCAILMRLNRFQILFPE